MRCSLAKPRASVQKRQKELAKLEKRQSKEIRKQQRDADREDRGLAEGDADPDLAGIEPGPQAPPEAFRE